MARAETSITQINKYGDIGHTWKNTLLHINYLSKITIINYITLPIIVKNLNPFDKILHQIKTL